MGMCRSVSMVWMSRSGPLSKAALIRFIPETVGSPAGIVTQRSRGMESIQTSLVAGTNRATMVTSLRWLVVVVPQACRCWASFTNDRESEPTSRMLNGWAVLALPAASAVVVDVVARWGMWTFLIWLNR